MVESFGIAEEWKMIRFWSLKSNVSFFILIPSEAGKTCYDPIAGNVLDWMWTREHWESQGRTQVGVLWDTRKGPLEYSLVTLDITTVLSRHWKEAQKDLNIPRNLWEIEERLNEVKELNTSTTSLLAPGDVFIDIQWKLKVGSENTISLEVK